MRKSRFSEAQIVEIIKESEAGAKTPELCRRHGISHNTFYKWKAKYGGMEVSDVRRLRALEDENKRQPKYVMCGAPVPKARATHVRLALELEACLRSLRHTYASLALKGAVPVTTVSANLGHSSTATTMNVYAHHIPSLEDAAAKVLERALVGAS